MPDPIYFSLWFSSFEQDDVLPRTILTLHQFPFSKLRPGVTYLALQPISWNEPTILEQRFTPGLDPEAAADTASELLHEDYAYVFEAYWDLWTPGDTEAWVLRPALVRFIAQAAEFDEGTATQTGHILIDLGPESVFLQEGVALTPDAQARVWSNVQTLVEFTKRVEKNSGATARLLWSESGEDLAQKLIARLQKVQ